MEPAEYNKTFVVSDLPTQTEPASETSRMKKKLQTVKNSRFQVLTAVLVRARVCWNSALWKWLINLIILIPVPCVFYYFLLLPTNAKLFHKLSHSYMFRHYRVILRELVIKTLPSYTSTSYAAVDNTIYN